MKQRLVHPKSILKGIVLTLVVLLFLQTTQTSSLAVHPQVAAGEYHTVGLKSDGTVMAVGWNIEGQLNVGSWTDIVQVAAGNHHTVGMKSDGTVVAVGMDDGQLNVGSWTDIVQVAAGGFHTVGVKSDGTVVAVGRNDFGQINVGSWTDIAQVAASEYHTVGAKSDGTVVAVGDNHEGQLNVGSWTDIVQVAAGSLHTLGVKSDGTVVAMGANYVGQLNVSSWTDIVQVATGWQHNVGVKFDGTVVAVGWNQHGQLNVGSWTDIVQVAAGYSHTAGAKSDGTVVAVGENHEGQCNVSDWNLIVAKSLLYTPVTPCRIADTRKTSAGIIVDYTHRNFRVFGSGDAINAQGGNPAGCPSPLGQPLAAHINMVAVNPTDKGNLQAFPVGAGTGAGLSVNYNTINTNLANAGTVKTITGSGPDITVASNFSSAHTAIDVLGYYYPVGDLLYTAVKPCRIVDTRKTSAGIIDADTDRDFRVYGTVSGQGGNPAGCSSPMGEPLAAHINMVAVNPTGKGNLQAFPVGAGTGAGLSVNYNTIDTNLANAGTVKTVTGSGADITVASNFSSAHTVIDVLGYYYSAP